jgi:hypothetical protein
MNTKVDFKKSLKGLYNPKKSSFHLVDVPPMNFLMIDGKGDPNNSIDYQDAIGALYTLSYSLKFALKSHGYDHVIPPIEGLWWIENMQEFSFANKDLWVWTMMIMQPEWITQEWVELVRKTAKMKKDNPFIDKVRFERFHEGLSVQFLYTGAYDNEAPRIAEMHKFILTNGYMVKGKHHEIYLGDPRKTSPERLKTVIRQPVMNLLETG